MVPSKRQYSSYVIPESLSHRPPFVIRLSRVLRYLVLLTFCTMISLSGYIFLTFQPTLENGQIISQRRTPGTKYKRESGLIFAPRPVPDGFFKNGSSFRERYQHLYDSQFPSIGPDFVRDNRKYFIYRCDKGKMPGCDDWADHVKGIEAAYLIANLTGRVFKVEIFGFPCRISDFVQPNLVNWTLQKTFHTILNKGMAGISLRNFDNNYSFHKNLYKLDLLEIVQENFEHVYFKSNLDYMSGFQNSTLYRKELSWMKGLGRDEINAILYKRLFILAPRLQRRLELFLYSILPSPEHRLICVDFATKNNYSNASIDAYNNQMNLLSAVWSFIRTHSRTNIDKVFINTDSKEIFSQAAAESFKNRLVTAPQTSPLADQSQDSVCDSLETGIFNQHILVNCDILVVTTHGLGRLAAYLRGTDHGLYCLMGNGHIHPCRADSLNELYKIHG